MRTQIRIAAAMVAALFGTRAVANARGTPGPLDGMWSIKIKSTEYESSSPKAKVFMETDIESISDDSPGDEANIVEERDFRHGDGSDQQEVEY
jgi:hypothetical protein